MDVFLVTLRSTGEIWHQYVCATADAVKRTLANHGITEIAHGSLEGDWCELYCQPEPTQTATVVRRALVQ